MYKYLKIISPFIIAILAYILIICYFKNKEKSSSIYSERLDKPISMSYKLIGSSDKKWTTKEEIKELFEQLDLIYSDELIFSEECTYLSNINKSQLKFEAPIKELDLQKATYYKECVSRHYKAPLYIKWINESIGYGVFAEKDIMENEYIMEYTGYVIGNVDDTTYCWSYPCISGGFGLEKKRYKIDARIIGGEARFVNDPIDKNNVNIKLAMVYNEGTYHIVYIASKNIKTDEQLFINYGEQFWEKRKSTTLL